MENGKRGASRDEIEKYKDGEIGRVMELYAKHGILPQDFDAAGSRVERDANAEVVEQRRLEAEREKKLKLQLAQERKQEKLDTQNSYERVMSAFNEGSQVPDTDLAIALAQSPP